MAYAMVKGLKIDLGSDGPENRFTTGDIQFIGRVLTVAAFLEIPATIGRARDELKPIPSWHFATHSGDFDQNDNGDGDAFWNEFFDVTLDDDAARALFLDKLESCLMLQTVAPRRYIINRNGRSFTNTGMAAKIILALNEVKLTSTLEKEELTINLVQ